MLSLYDVGELSAVVRLCVVDDVMVNDYLAGTAEVDGEFEYVRFEEIDDLDDCRS